LDAYALKKLQISQDDFFGFTGTAYHGLIAFGMTGQVNLDNKFLQLFDMDYIK
jgi:hypothetical protein